MSIIEKALDKLESTEKVKKPAAPRAQPEPSEEPDPLAEFALTDEQLEEVADDLPLAGAPPTPAPTAGPTPAPAEPVVAASRPVPPTLMPEPPAAVPKPDALVTSRRVELDLARLERSGFLTPNQSQMLIAEEYRHLKRPLLRRATPGDPDYVDNGNMLIMTSSLPGEGKTYMSINLAMSIAMEVDRTVLLVDGDVAKADVSRVLGVHGESGLSSYLQGKETDLSKLILRTNVEKLAVLPSGPHHSKLTELLASDQMTALVKELSERYPDRIVLFDSPPLLATSGASVLAHIMGQVLMVVEAVRTPRSAVKAALRQLAGVRCLNFVLNKQRRALGGAYGYGYGYSYGSRPYGYGNRPTEA